MNTRISAFIEDHRANGILFVVKGYQTEDFDVPRVKIANTIANKILRLMSLTQQDHQIIAFDEFISLNELVLMQYKKIYIIENPIYHYLYPIGVELLKSTSDALLSHFDDDADENKEIGEVMEYTNIYSNFIRTEQGLACCYNIDENLLNHEKIERYVIGTIAKPIIVLTDISEEQEYLNICNDIDYFQLVQRLCFYTTAFAVTWESYVAGKETMQKKLNLLSAIFPNRIFAYLVPATSQKKASNPEFQALLEKYWGYSSFREIKVYNINKVEEMQKEVSSISQEQIINDLVEQVEHCINGENFKDIFVTAPTGSGKSLMFQLPAMYIAEKYNLITLVITPLIGLMNDQVQALVSRGYTYAKTINSDIPPIIKQEILEEVASGKCHILYLSPESLLSRSDIEQLIGTRRIGMLVVDEAHIVTTWGKQFRPDYWYLGDHVQKIRRAQTRAEKNPSPFIVATFTATAIYEGKEDMYHETLNSLHMIDPITYLGYVKRDNIEIEISKIEAKKNKIEYEINKFDSLIAMMNTALMRNQKTLIYFPTVALINRFYDYCYTKGLKNYVTKYHGQLEAAEKNENFRNFLNGDRCIMLATKAFGMGIDIPNIDIVSHFAPTGNVCDYMQEIGRVARKSSIEGHAIYRHMSNDFKHINQLHGLSAIQRYQLVEVIKKILEIYTNTRYRNTGRSLTKKRNEMLVDAESFAYIFGRAQSDDNDLINKVKTAMLLIQKDYENSGFAPFYMRPIPLFAYGYFSITPREQAQLNSRYDDAVKLVFNSLNVCEVNLKSIWERSYSQNMSFPKFKYLLYSRSQDLKLNSECNLVSAMMVEVFMAENGEHKFLDAFEAIKAVTHLSLNQGKYYSLEEIVQMVSESTKLSNFRVNGIVEVIIAAMDLYQREYSRMMNAKMYQARISQNGKISYQFLSVSRNFFAWLSKGYKYVLDNVRDQKIYIVNDLSNTRCKEITTILGILESIGVLRFKSLGGSNSQLYIYVNETKRMQMVRDRPNSYRNRLLELINTRHSESVKMLTFLFQNELTSEDVWEHLENYFLGILPKALSDRQDEAILVDDDFKPGLLLQVGDNLKEDYPSWNQANVLFDHEEIGRFEELEIPLADYYGAKLIIGDYEISASLVWANEKIAITNGEEQEELRQLAKNHGWDCIKIDTVTAIDLTTYFER